MIYISHTDYSIYFKIYMIYMYINIIHVLLKTVGPVQHLYFSTLLKQEKIQRRKADNRSSFFARSE